MSRLPACTASDVIRALKRAGFTLDHTTGSHYFFRHPKRPREGSNAANGGSKDGSSYLILCDCWCAGTVGDGAPCGRDSNAGTRRRPAVHFLFRGRQRHDDGGQLPQWHMGTLGSAVTWAAGHTGKGVQFDPDGGTNSVVTFGPNDTFDGLTEGSITAWINVSGSDIPSNGAAVYFFSGEATGNCSVGGLYLLLGSDAGGLYWSVDGCHGGDDFNGYYYLAATPSNWTGWHHFVYTVSTGGNKFYLDGVETALSYVYGDASTQAFFSQYGEGTSVYWIGNDDYVETFSGIVDDFRIYDKALTAAEVGTVMNDTSPCPPPSCVGDCDGLGQVTVDEILAMVNIALGNADASACRAGDANHDDEITVNEILTSVNNALSGCPPGSGKRA